MSKILIFCLHHFYVDLGSLLSLWDVNQCFFYYYFSLSLVLSASFYVRFSMNIESFHSYLFC